jgi:hypothetical protein
LWSIRRAIAAYKTRFDRPGRYTLTASRMTSQHLSDEDLDPDIALEWFEIRHPQQDSVDFLGPCHRHVDQDTVQEKLYALCEGNTVARSTISDNFGPGPDATLVYTNEEV